MGKSLSYCFKCSKLIREEEFVKGKAFNLGDKVSCSACAREVGAVVVPGAVQPPPPPPPSSTHRKVIVIREPAAAKPRMPMLAGAIVVAGALIAGVLVLSNRSEPDPAPVPAPAAPSPREPAARPAVEKVASVQERRQRDLAALEEKIREPMAKRKFEVVVGILEEGVKRDPDPAWTEPLRRRIIEVRGELAKVDPDLLGHYTFDEGQGSQAQDSSGRGPAGVIIGATWTDGRIGKALRFNGVQSYVEFPNTPEFDTLLENSFTIAAWFKPEADPPVKDANQGFAIVIKEGRHVGLVQKTSVFQLEYWLQDMTWVGAHFSPPPTIGRFYHLAGVVDRPRGLTRLVIDGKEAATGKFPPGARPIDNRKGQWRVGMAYTNPAQSWALPAKCIIDDVWFYRRALTDEEIQRLIPK